MPSFGLNGQPVIAELQFYENGTTTPATVYADAALSTPLTWPLVSNTSGQFPAVWAADDAVYSVLWSTNDGQSQTWDDVSGETTANGALLAGAQTAETNAETAQTAAEAAQAGAEAAEASAAVILAEVLAAGGYDGYSPILAVATDGVRKVLQITDWTGGAGPKPTTGYLGASGIVADIADGVNIAGSATGNVNQTGSVTAGHLAVWAATETIEDGGAAGGMANLDVASQAEAEAGSSNTVGMTPLRVAQAIAALGTSNLRLLTKTANYQLVLADAGALVDCSGTFTLSFAAAAALGNNWFCYTYNSGTGDVTYDPNGSETIDGLTTFITYPGELRIIRCNGTALTSYVLKGFSKVFTSSGTFTKPPGYNDFEGEAWGGGGSGSATSGEGAGGGGGACNAFKLRNSAINSTETVTIGAGGAAVTASTGNDGGNTTFGTLVTAYGGQGANGTTVGGGGGGAFAKGSSATGGSPRTANANNPGYGGGDAGGGGASGFASIYGGGGGGGSSAGVAAPGGASIYGGGGGGAVAGGAPSFAGASSYGGAGGAAGYNANGTAGSAPGGGGGGAAWSSGSYTSGAGGRGELRIRGVA